MAQQWRVGVRGKQRSDIDVSLLIEAVIALERQLRREQQLAQAADATSPRDGDVPDSFRP